MLNRDLKILIVLLILIGLILSLIIFLSLFSNSIEINIENFQDDIIPQHYDLEFIDQIDYMICHTKIYFQLIKNRYEILIIKSIDHIVEISSIRIYQNNISIPIHIEITDDEIIIKKYHKNKLFYIGNYSILIHTHVNISTKIQTSFIRQIWSSKYRILFTNNYLFPYISHRFYQSTFNMNIISSDSIISNLPIQQISSLFDISQIAFALLQQYECRSIDILQLCFPNNFFYDMDLFSSIFNYTLNTIQIFESYFSRKFPLNKLIFITVLELNNRMISKSSLVFIDQNILLNNITAEHILQQYESIYLILAYQWIDTLIHFDNENKWIGKSLAKTIANYLFNKIYNPTENNHLQIERFMSTVVIDSLCNMEQLNNIKFENNFIEKGEAFLTEYRLHIGDIQFQSRIQQLIQYSNTSYINQSIFSSILFNNNNNNSSSFLTWSKIPGHPIVYLNSSTFNTHLFKLNSNCSISISSNHFVNNSSTNPFIHIFYSSWNNLIDELKTIHHQQLTLFSKILFDSFLFNLANQLSIKYPLQLINIFFQQQQILTKNNLIFINQILKWYRLILLNDNEEKFLIFLRKILHPYCLNHLWTRQIFIDNNQQIINDIFLELCCSINHSICLQQISNKNDPQILIQFIINNKNFPIYSFDLISIKLNQTDMLTSFNQLHISSPFIYSDRIIFNIICQIIRQQNTKYWYDFIYLIQQKFQFIPLSILNGLSCGIQTLEQIDYYLYNLCPSSPFKWPCYRNIIAYSSIKNFQQLNTIDNEQWPLNLDELVDFLFYTSTIQRNFTSHSIIYEFQSIISTWLTTNQYEFLHWLDNENNQNAYLI